MENAQAGASDNSAFFSDYVQVTVGVGKHTFQRFACEDDAAGEFLHQGGKVGKVGRGVCEEFVHC